MAELASAILALIGVGLKTWKEIDKVVNLIKNAPRNVEHWNAVGGVLIESLRLMETKIKARKDNLTGPEQNLCEAISKFTEEFVNDLKELKGTIPKKRSGNKYWLALKLKLQEDHQLLERMSRNIQIFQLSASALSLLDPPSVSGPGIRVQNFLEGISDKNPRYLDEKEKPDLNKWIEAVYGIADVAAQHDFSDSTTVSPPVAPSVLSGNEARRRPSSVSATELRYRFEVAVSRAKLMYREGLPVLAKRAYEKAIKHQEEMQSIDENAIGVVNLVDMEISYIRAIEACVPYTKSYEALVWERLEKLKDSVREQSQSGLDTNQEFCNEQEKLGILCANLRDREGAIEFLRLSLDTYLSSHEGHTGDIQRLSRLVCEQYAHWGQGNELEAFRKYLFETLGFDPTSEPNALARTIAWCNQHGYQAEERAGRLFIPQKYLVNSTLLHEAAADMDIQQEVIHQLMQIVQHTEPDANGDTPLLVAVQHSNNTAVQALSLAIGSVHVRGAKGRTPLHLCNNEETMELLLKELKKPVNPSTSPEPGFELVLIDSTDIYGATALHEACEKGNERLVRLLIDEGADVNFVSGSNETPLMITCAPSEYNKGKGKLNRARRCILEMLVNCGAKTDYKDNWGKPAVLKSLKTRGYSKAEIDSMLSPDPTRNLMMNRGRGNN